MSLIMGAHPEPMTTVIVQGSVADLAVPAEMSLTAPTIEFGPNRAADPSVSHTLASELGAWVVHLTEAQVAALSGLHYARLRVDDRIIAAGQVQHNPGWDGRTRSRASTSIVFGPEAVALVTAAQAAAGLVGAPAGAAVTAAIGVGGAARATLETAINGRAVRHDAAQALAGAAKTQARDNMGLGSAATAATGDFATAAQGAKADSAVQPAALGTAAPADIGTGAGQVKPGDWKPAAADVTDSTATGRSVLTAADGPAARSAIGAVDQAAIDTAITNLINGAPGALDTLNELSSALGGDANFSTTVTAALGNRLRVDAAQTLTDTQKARARDNTGTGSAKESGGASAYTKGNRVRVGDFAYITRADAGTCYVAGGAPNNAGTAGLGYENVIGGNIANIDTTTSNLTGAPTLTNEDGNWSAILWGYDTVVNGWANVVAGFHSSVDAGANHATVSGGSRNKILANSSYNAIGGGTGNTASGAGSTIGGGVTNTASGNNSVISGGTGHTTSASAATVGGGAANQATGANATVAGGNTCTATANSATVAGGLTNTASGQFSAVPGGRDNVSQGDYSVATGRGAVATNVGEHAHANGVFAAAGDAQTSVIVLRRATTDATTGRLQLAGYDPTIPADTTWAFSLLVTARRTDVDGENAGWEVKGVMKRDAGSTAAFVGTPTVTSIGANAGNVWTLAAQAISTGVLSFNCTGEAGKTIRWVGRLTIVQTQG